MEYTGDVFGVSGAGDEFLLLEDGSIGYNSSEGETGRVAENLEELLILLIYFPYFSDYCSADLYKDEPLLEKFVQIMTSEYREEFDADHAYTWEDGKNEIIEKLNLTLYSDNPVEIIKRFHKAASREPQYQYTYTEGDGSGFTSEALLSRPLGKWIPKKVGVA